MIQSEKINDLLAELAEVQNELPTMPKSTEGYGYKYTDLDTITQTIKPILHNHGIGYIQSVGGLSMNGMTLTTRIFNKAGQYIEDTAALPAINSAKNNAAQTLGMSITYMRRYALCAMLGITSEEDIDANTDGGDNTASRPSNTRTLQPPKQAAKPKQPAKLPFTPKGGESTPEEKKELGNLLASKDANGKPIFTRDEMKKYSDMRKDYTAREVIDAIKKELQTRLNPTQTMQTAGDIMRAHQKQQAPQQPLPKEVEAVKEAFDGEVVTPPQQPGLQPVEQSEQGFGIF